MASENDSYWRRRYFEEHQEEEVKPVRPERRQTPERRIWIRRQDDDRTIDRETVEREHPDGFATERHDAGSVGYAR
jgi:hypothetical protein